MPLKNTLTKMPLESECSFFCSTVQGSTIRGVLETLKDVVYEACFKFTRDGIKLITLDSSKKSLVYLNLHSESFDTYSCESDMVIGVNLASFTKLLKSVNKNIITFFVEKNNPYSLGLVIESHEKKRVSIFRVPVLDIEFSDMRYPEMDFDATLQLQSADFQKLCRELAVVGDIVDIQTDGLNISMGSSGGALGTEQMTEFCTNSDSDTETETESTEPMKKKQRIEAIGGRFEMKYLTLFSKSATLSPFMNVCMAKAKPLVLQYNAGCLGELIFVLTPI